jgi:hypothetical protein
VNAEMTPKVYNRNKPHPYDAINVMRPSLFGNPFKIGDDGTRNEVIDKYEFWIFQPEQKHIREKAIAVLRGKSLICCCAPLPCHADILLRIANAE